MNKSVTIVILALLLFLSSFTVYPVSSQTYPSYVNAYIIEDGTVQGTNNIQRNGDYYTFTGDVTGALVVEKDNIVIDGAGYTLSSSRARGIVLENRTGVTLKNTRITLDGGYVIDLRQASNCTIVENTLVGTPQPLPGSQPTDRLLGPIGVNLLLSKNITLKDNTITNFSYAFSLDWSNGHTITGNTLTDGIVGLDFTNTTDCFLRNNHLTNCSFSVRAYSNYQYNNDIDTSNTVDGKPIIYWVNVKDKTVPADVSTIVLVGCRNITVEELSTQSIAVLTTNNCTIRKVAVTGRGGGIELLDSSSINILDNIINGQAIGITLDGSSNNLIKGNIISHHTTRGINLNNATSNVIIQNQIINNTYAIAPFQDTPSKSNLVALNNFVGNDYTISLQGHMQIVGNIFDGNKHAIMVSGTGSTITQNTFVNNEEALYFGDSSGNNIYLNNFLQNGCQIRDGGANSTYITPQKTNTALSGSVKTLTVSVEPVNFMPPPPLSVNNWDNGSKGNYWINYQGSDINGDGVGDNPYYLYENNKDNFPLMNQVSVPDVTSLFSDSQLTLPNTTEQPSEENVSIAGTEIPIGYTVVAITVLISLLIAGLIIIKVRKQKSV